MIINSIRNALLLFPLKIAIGIQKEKEKEERKQQHHVTFSSIALLALLAYVGRSAYRLVDWLVGLSPLRSHVLRFTHLLDCFAV